jgi:hypothetical protein
MGQVGFHRVGNGPQLVRGRATRLQDDKRTVPPWLHEQAGHIGKQEISMLLPDEREADPPCHFTIWIIDGGDGVHVQERVSPHVRDHHARQRRTIKLQHDRVVCHLTTNPCSTDTNQIKMRQ